MAAQVGALPITEKNRGLLRSAYVKRRPEELAVLARCLCALDPNPRATCPEL